MRRRNLVGHGDAAQRWTHLMRRAVVEDEESAAEVMCEGNTPRRRRRRRAQWRRGAAAAMEEEERAAISRGETRGESCRDGERCPVCGGRACFHVENRRNRPGDPRQAGFQRRPWSGPWKFYAWPASMGKRSGTRRGNVFPNEP